MRSLSAMIKANLKMTVRNRQAIFWNLAFPAIFILIFGTVFGKDPSVSFSIGIVGPDSQIKSETVSAMESNDAFKVSNDSTEQEELDKLKDGDRDIVLVFGEQPADGSQPTVQLYYDGSNGPTSNVAISVVNQVLLTVAQGENPIQIQQTPVSTTEVSYIEFLVPGILAMAIMNSGVIGLSTAFVTYREKGILRRIKVTPFPLPSFVFARVLSQLIVAVAQSVILIGMGVIIFGLNIHGNPVLILSMIIVGALAFLAIGFAVSGIAKNTETAASYANLITFPMLFLSGVFFDVDSAPAWLRPITKVLPLRYLVDGLREPMTRGKGFADVWVDFAVLLATFAIAMFIAIRFFKWDSRAT